MGCFNTQPPEGGWASSSFTFRTVFSFNTQPPEGGWAIQLRGLVYTEAVSTHSRPKAAGKTAKRSWQRLQVSTHSRPKAAGTTSPASSATHSRFNTQPPEGGWMEGL